MLITTEWICGHARQRFTSHKIICAIESLNSSYYFYLFLFCFIFKKIEENKNYQHECQRTDRFQLCTEEGKSKRKHKKKKTFLCTTPTTITNIIICQTNSFKIQTKIHFFPFVCANGIIRYVVLLVIQKKWKRIRENALNRAPLIVD